MKPIIINGLWFCQSIRQNKMDGVRRYAFETVKNMDLILDRRDTGLDIRIVIPSSLKTNEDVNLSDLRHIQFVRLNTNGHRFNSYALRKYVNKNNGICCNLGSEISYNRNGIVCVHDVIEFITKGLISTGADKRRAYLRKWSAKLTHSTVVTVSEYQKMHICKLYRLPENRVIVIPNGWEHMNEIVPDNDVFLRHPEIKMDDYYYAVGSVAKHKNYKWIHEIAKRYKSKQFVITGNINKDNWQIDDTELRLPNVIFTGYVTDGENKALMQHCRALLQPSKHEGFGIPPLEALSLGKKIIISNATCLPEIYGESAAYFDPDDYEVDLDELESRPVHGADEVLEKYTWKNAAEKWLDLFNEVSGDS